MTEGQAIGLLVRYFPGVTLVRTTSRPALHRNPAGLQSCSRCRQGTVLVDDAGQPYHRACKG